MEHTEIERRYIVEKLPLLQRITTEHQESIGVNDCGVLVAGEQRLSLQWEDGLGIQAGQLATDTTLCIFSVFNVFNH